MMPDTCPQCGSTDVGRLQEQVQPRPIDDNPYDWPEVWRCRDCGALLWDVLSGLDLDRWILMPGHEARRIDSSGGAARPGRRM